MARMRRTGPRSDTRRLVHSTVGCDSPELHYTRPQCANSVSDFAVRRVYPYRQVGRCLPPYGDIAAIALSLCEANGL